FGVDIVDFARRNQSLSAPPLWDLLWDPAGDRYLALHSHCEHRGAPCIRLGSSSRCIRAPQYAAPQNTSQASNRRRGHPGTGSTSPSPLVVADLTGRSSILARFVARVASDAMDSAFRGWEAGKFRRVCLRKVWVVFRGALSCGETSGSPLHAASGEETVMLQHTADARSYVLGPCSANETR
ncbi:hypothetical protein B0H12DRAFT_1159094, partial [Mycena haematopus]